MQKPFFLIKYDQQKGQNKVELNCQKIVKQEPHHPPEFIEGNEF
jgi:hypothetical protein